MSHFHWYSSGFANDLKRSIRPLRTATPRSWQPGGFGDYCLPDGIFHGTLDYRFVEVMPTPDAGLAVDVVTAWRKNPLPTPLAVGIRILRSMAWGSATPPVPVARSVRARL